MGVILPDSLEVVVGALRWHAPPKKGLTRRDEDFRSAFTAGWNSALKAVAKQGLGYEHPYLPPHHERLVDESSPHD